MIILTDTNVLVALMNEKQAEYRSGWRAIEHLLSRGDRLAVTPQNLMELWSTCTRPRLVGGLELTPELACAVLDKIELTFVRLPDSETVYETWRRIVSRYRVSGRQVHDTHLVASMLVHGISNILTFNGKDFLRYQEITVLDPIAISQH